MGERAGFGLEELRVRGRGGVQPLATFGGAAPAFLDRGSQAFAQLGNFDLHGFRHRVHSMSDILSRSITNG
jgi:hypothetical protein